MIVNMNHNMKGLKVKLRIHLLKNTIVIPYNVNLLKKKLKIQI